MVKIYNTANQFKAAEIIDALKDAGIPAYQMEDGVGSYTNIVMGLSVGGYDVYVDESQVENAQRLVRLLDYEDVSDDAYEINADSYDSNDDDDFDEAAALKKVHRLRVIFVICVLAIPVIMYIITQL